MNDGHEDAEWINIDDISDGPECMIDIVAREKAMEKKASITEMYAWNMGKCSVNTKNVCLKIFFFLFIFSCWEGGGVCF